MWPALCVWLGPLTALALLLVPWIVISLYGTMSISHTKHGPLLKVSFVINNECLRYQYTDLFYIYIFLKAYYIRYEHFENIL